MTPDRPYSSDAASSITSKPLAAARLGHALPEVTGFQKAIDGVCDSRRVADGYEQAVDSILDEFPTNPGVRRNQELSIRLSFDVDKAERFPAGWLHEHSSGGHQVAFLPVIDWRQIHKTPKISRLRLKVILEGLHTGTNHYQSSLRTVRSQNLHCFYDRNTPLLECFHPEVQDYGRISQAEFATARFGSPPTAFSASMPAPVVTTRSGDTPSSTRRMRSKSVSASTVSQ